MRAAIIPARGGSKRIPRKNIKPFAGKPMLAHAVSAVMEAGLFDTVVISSDDSEILEVAQNLGASALRRPQALADDWTPTIPVIAHAIEILEQQSKALDLVCCVYPAVPFLQQQDLSDALTLLEQGNAYYAFPVVRFPSAIQRALRLSQDGKVSSFNPEMVNARSQDLEAAYYDAGQFYWGRRDAWLSEVPIHLNGLGLVIPEWRAVDIDTPDDWKRAELMYHLLTRREGAD
jgi:pseudaminic acid cytidylyltransferase